MVYTCIQTKNKRQYTMPALSLIPTRDAKIVASTHSADKRWDRLPIYLDENEHGGQKSITLPPTVSLAVEPTRDKGARDVAMVSGRSGSGKSYWAADFAQRYHAIHGARRPIVLISALSEDPTFDRLRFIRRIRIDSLVESPLTLDEFPDGGLVIVDDVESASKVQEAAIEAMLTLLLTQGRHAQVSVLVLQHLSSNYRKTRLILHEATLLVMFPGGSSASQMRHTLNYHGGLDASSIARFRKLPSRWTVLKTTFPSVVFYQSGCYLTNEDE
jgi:hypothetical protein